MKRLIIFILLAIPIQIYSEECPSNKTVYKSDDGAYEFLVSRVAYKAQNICHNHETELRDYNSKMYMEIYTPDINFSWSNDVLVIKDRETNKEKETLQCKLLNLTQITEGLYNNELTYFIELTTTSAMPCCTVQKLSELEFQKKFGSPEHIKWLTDEEAAMMKPAGYYNQSQSDTPEIQVYNGIENSGPILKLSECRD